MLTKEEENFILYWEANRDKQKKLFWQLAMGLPAGALLAIGILATLFSGWNDRASMIATTEMNPAVLIFAILLIVVFVAIFSKKHKWDMNEEQYQELIIKKKRINAQQATNQNRITDK